MALVLTLKECLNRNSVLRNACSCERSGLPGGCDSTFWPENDRGW